MTTATPTEVAVSRKSAHRELNQEGHREEHGRREVDAASPHGGDPVPDLDAGGDGDEHTARREYIIHGKA